MIIESFLENNDNIISLRMMIEIIFKGMIFEIIFLETMIVSFPENDYKIIF